MNANPISRWADDLASVRDVLKDPTLDPDTRTMLEAVCVELEKLIRETERVRHHPHS